MATSFLKKLDLFTPILCRLLAVRYSTGNGNWPVPLTDEEIAQASGLTIPQVRMISLHTTWDPVTVATMRSFVVGCRLNLGNWGAHKRLTRIINRGKFEYLRRSPLWAVQFRELLSIWEASNDV